MEGLFIDMVIVTTLAHIFRKPYNLVFVVTRLSCVYFLNLFSVQITLATYALSIFAKSAATRCAPHTDGTGAFLETITNHNKLPLPPTPPLPVFTLQFRQSRTGCNLIKTRPDLIPQETSSYFIIWRTTYFHIRRARNRMYTTYVLR